MCYFQSFQSSSSHFQQCPAKFSHIRPFQPFLAISLHIGNAIYFQTIPATSSYFQPLLNISSHISHSSHFKHFQAISSHAQPFTAVKAIYSHSSHLQPVLVISSHLQQFLANSSHSNLFPANSSHSIPVMSSLSCQIQPFPPFLSLSGPKS